MHLDTSIRSNPQADALLQKERALHDVLRDCGSVVIGFSGGVDSAYLAKAALDALGPECVLAVTGRSASYPEVQHEMALEVARSIGLPHLEIETRELEDPNYAANPTDRCYYCKKELYGQLADIADARNATVIDGSNADDLDDHRPGMTAARERGVRSPLQEAGLSKDDIRSLSRLADLPTWDLPASPCLASRVAYGIEVTPRRLRQIEEAESRLRELRGWRELRVRYHGGLVRLEVAPDDLTSLVDGALRARVVGALEEAGFSSGCVDLAGYRRGALNEKAVSAPRPVAGSATEGAAARLARIGVEAVVETAGRAKDVALIRVDEPFAGELLGRRREKAVEAVRAAGFRYVALEIF
jgi:uncharacterized protein